MSVTATSDGDHLVFVHHGRSVTTADIHVYRYQHSSRT